MDAVAILFLAPPFIALWSSVQVSTVFFELDVVYAAVVAVQADLVVLLGLVKMLVSLLGGHHRFFEGVVRHVLALR